MSTHAHCVMQSCILHALPPQNQNTEILLSGRPPARRSLLADMDYSIDLANEDPRTHTSMRTQRLARWPRTSTRLSGSRVVCLLQLQLGNVRQEAGLVCCADPAGLPRAIDHEPDPRTRAIGHILVITSSSSLLSTAATLRVHPIRTKTRTIHTSYVRRRRRGWNAPAAIHIDRCYVRTPMQQ
jgi:hypothetical protein